MQRDPLTYAIIGFLAGAVVVWFAATNAVNNNMTGMMRMMGMRQTVDVVEPEEEETPERHMEEMMEVMEGKKDDDFDKAFIETMIIHHQGAIDMAREAQQKAKHAEIKQLSGEIISAQSKEIDMMRQLQ